MVSFDARIEWEYFIREPYRRRLTHPFNFEVDGQMFIIQPGYYTDGASIPRWLWSVAGSPFTGKYVLAALIHDILYATNFYSKDQCDSIFREAMHNSGVSDLRAWGMYRAVCMFGDSSYSKNKDEIAGASRHLTMTYL